MAAKKIPAKPLSSFDDLDAAGIGVGYQPFAADAVAPMETPAEPERTWGAVAKDVGVSALKGAIAVPESIVGMANLVSGGRAGKALEDVGFRPGEAKSILDEQYSDKQKQAFQSVSQAEGFTGKMGAALANPSVIGHTLVESAPLMGMGWVIGRGVMAAAPRVSGVIAGAIGEGAVGAGSSAEAIRQASQDGTLTGKQAALAGASGALTGAFTLLGGKVAQKLGIADVDTMLAGAATNPAVRKGVVRSALEGAAAEGILEELPQSVQEQVLQNAALGKPLDEGVDQAAVMGLLSGMAMGGGANAVSSFAKPPAQAAADTIRNTEKVPESGALTKALNAGVEAKAQAVEAGAPVDGQIAPNPAPDPVDDPVRDQILDLPDGARQDALRAYAVVNRTDVAKGVQQYNRKLLDRLLAENAPPPVLGERLTDTDMGAMLGGGGMTGNADPLMGALGMNREAQANSISNVARAAENRPPMPASDAARMLDEARNQGVDLAVTEHPAGGFVLVPPQWVTPDMAAQGEQRLNETIARMQQADAAPVERAPRTSTAPVDLSLPTDPVQNYVGNLRQVNTPAAQAFVRDFDAGRITPADVQRRMAAEQGATPDQRIARAASEAPATTDPVADRLQRAASQGMATPAPTDILNPSGQPFKTMMAANLAAKKTPGEVVPVEGGFVVRPQESVNVQDVPQAPEVPQAAPAVSQPGQAPQAVGTQPASPAAGVSAEGAGAVEAAGVEAGGREGYDTSVQLDAQSTQQQARAGAAPVLDGDALERKTDELMEKVVVPGGINQTRDQVRALIQQKGVAAADKTIAGYQDHIAKQAESTRKYSEAKEKADSARKAPVQSGDKQPAVAPSLFSDPRTGAPVVVPNKATADAMARSKQLSGKVAVRKATPAEMADERNAFTGYNAGEARRMGYVLEMLQPQDVRQNKPQTEAQQAQAATENVATTNPQEGAAKKTQEARIEELAQALKNTPEYLPLQGVSVEQAKTDTFGISGSGWYVMRDGQKISPQFPTKAKAEGFVSVMTGDRNPEHEQLMRELTGAANQLAQPQAAPATHADPGQAPEVATPAVVTDSLKKAARNEDTKPSEMRKWLVAEIDKAIAVAPDRSLREARELKKNWPEGQQRTEQAVNSPHPLTAEAANPEADSPDARPAGVSVPPAAPTAQPDTPKLTPAEATALMAWEDLGQKDGVKTHALTFYESQADKDAKRGRMIVAKVSKGDRSATAWMVDGEDKTFGMLAQAKKLAEEVGMARAVADGFVEQAIEAPKSTAKPAAPATTSAPIEDAGEKIGGARKDRWKERGLNLDDLDAMTEAEGAELATKANVWKPDYEALSKASEPVTAAMVKTIYDQLAAKPKKNTPEGRRQYVQMMRIVRDVLTEAKGPEAVRNAYQEIRKRAGLNTMEPQAKAAARELLFSVYKGRSDPFVMNGADLMKVKKMVEDGFPAKGEPWKTRLTVGRREGGNGTTERGIEMYMELSAEVGTPLTREQIEAGFFRVQDKQNKTVAFAASKEDADAAAATVYERDMKGKKDGKPEPVRPNLDELKRENLPSRRSMSSEVVVNRSFMDAQNAADLLVSGATPAEIERLLGVPLDSVTTTRSSGDVNSPVNEDATKLAAVNAELLRNLNDRGALTVQGISALPIESQRYVKFAVFRAAQDLQIRRAVIELIPVDVMNFLAGKKLSADSLLSNPSVFKDVFSIDGDEPVALDVISSLGKAVASARAKIVGAPDTVGAPLKGGSALGAQQRNHDAIEQDVDVEQFTKKFGFRALEWGNWSAQDERQRILNMAYDGLMDLAEIMGVPPKAMSLNGTLGMAFGARGGGRFAAHYEPGKLVINMTKIRGGGSMAHEWAHAMDHYFGELDKQDAYTTQARGASGWYSEDQYLGVPRTRHERIGNEWKAVNKMRLDNLRPEMAAAFDEVMRALFSKQITKAEMVRSHELDLERTEALARNETQADLKAMYQNMAQNKRQALNELRGDPEGTMYAGRGRSDYASQAQALSGKSENGYWTRPTEMFARAFESWVFDRVAAMGARSDYLVHGVEEDRFAGGAYKGNPYPTGEERSRINAAFDKLAQTIKTKETDKGVAMFSRTAAGLSPEQAVAMFSQATPPNPYPHKLQATLAAAKHGASAVQADNGGWLLAPKAQAYTAQELQDAQQRIDKLNRALGKYNNVTPAAVLSDAPTPAMAWGRSIARTLGYNVTFIQPNPDFHGVAVGGDAFVSASADHPEIGLIGHEVLHSFKQSSPDIYQALAERIRPYLKDGVVDAKRRWEDANGGRGTSMAHAEEEVLADLNGAMWLDPKFWREMAKNDQSLFRQVAYKFMEVATKAMQGLSRFKADSLVTDVDAVREIIAQEWAYQAQEMGNPSEFAASDSPAFSRGTNEAMTNNDVVGNQGGRSADDTTPGDLLRKLEGTQVVDPNGAPLLVYHGSKSQIDRFDASKTIDGGLHFGSKSQASMRSSKILHPAYLYAENLRRSKDTGSNWKAKIASAKAAGYDGIVYLNRYEGVSKETVFRLHSQGLSEKLDRMSDAEFRRAVPEAEDSYIVFDAKQVIQQNESSAPDSGGAAFSRTTDTAQAVGDTLKSITVSNVKKRAGFKLKDYLGIGLQALGRRQIVDIYGDLLPLAEYNRLVTQMEADKNEGGAEADKLVTRWADLEDEAKLADLMHDATLAQIDPDKDYVDGDDKGKFLMLERKFKLLSDDAKAVYRETRDAYKAHHAKVRSAIKERIERSELKGERKAELLKQMDDEFFAAVKGVYFPLARFGQYVVTVKGPDGKVESVSRAETMAEADALRTSLLDAFPKSQGFSVGRVMLSKEFVASRDAVGRGFMTELYQVLDKQDMDTTARAELEDTLGQLYLSSLPDLSWAKHGIHRKGTPGFSQDARRAYAQNMFHGSRYLAKLRYSDLMQDELTAMQKHVDDWREVEDFDQNSAQRVVDEMNKRHESLMNPKSNALSTALTSLGFVFHLGLSPASAMVNLSQTALVAYPIMGAKWGFGKASAALLKASAEAAKGKNDITGSLNADERAAYDEAVRAGTIDVTMAHDLAGIAQGEDAGVMWKIRPVMRYASFLFHHAERFNRQVTFVASYRLAREAGADHKTAFEQATKATYDGHFDYSASNRARIMQGNVAKVLLLFKQYGQNMVYTLARNAQQSIKGESPEVRAQARKALGGLLATHAAAAGVLGLPMVTTLLAAASMIGGDDDEPWDAKVALQNMLADTFGQKPAEVLAHGLSRLTPWDISGRVGLDRLIFPDVQEGLEGQRLWESAATQALGPVGGIFGGALKGLDLMSDGHYQLGLEAMLPAVLRQAVKSVRYGMDGAQDKTGVSIKDEVSMPAVVGQLLGFSPSEVRLAQEGKSAVYQQDRALGERRQELLTKAARATMAKDAEARAEAMKEIQRFNQKNPARRITPLNVLQSVRNRNRRIDQAEGGIYLPKNRRDAMEAGRFALAESE